MNELLNIYKAIFIKGVYIMKKQYLISALVFLLSACNNSTTKSNNTNSEVKEKNIISVSFVDQLDRDIVVGDSLNLDRYEISIKYDNGKSETKKLNKEDYVVNLDTSVASSKKKGTITLYGKNSVEFEIDVCEQSEELEIKNGKIIGYINEGVNVYKNIPYAKAPIGDLRWRKPQDVDNWEDVKKCQYWGNSPMQEAQKGSGNYTNEFVVTNKHYSEDCLNLNVWSKNDENKNKPVVVYVFGGAYRAGGSSCEIYEGLNTAKNDVVFVSINYRLGVFGFLATEELVQEDNEAAGNYGVYDVMKALSWVQENIAYFGGDKDNVTLMGQSAGAGMVNAVLSSEKSAGLFSQAQMDTYMTLGKKETRENRIKEAKSKKTFSTTSISDLRKMSAEEIFKLDYFPNGPVNDGVTIKGDYFDCIKNGYAQDVDIILGEVKSSSRPTEDYEFCAFRNYEYLMRNKYGYHGKVHIFYFDHEVTGANKSSSGVYHTYELPFLFNNFTDLRKDYWTKEDQDLASLMNKYFVELLKNHAVLDSSLPSWEDNKGDWKYMHFDNATTAKCKTIDEETISKIKEQYKDIANQFNV